ncbi:hypothetical protein Cgig2_034036 [Carnegiea gigantea]|uniref:Pentatricopeptide repeat-containing protein n=1 Tax=Carnegiea gigantea TaxID=171969 RepID=A0A9Q1GWL1_9CARY|nr:hypothetical protein Cgig2_034036 [Carnegiea gigantea]
MEETQSRKHHSGCQNTVAGVQSSSGDCCYNRQEEIETLTLLQLVEKGEKLQQADRIIADEVEEFSRVDIAIEIPYHPRYLQNENHQKCVDIFLQVIGGGAPFDHTTLAVVLKCCSFLENYDMGIQIHGLAVKMGFDGDMVSGSALVDMYAKCKYLDDSLKFFWGMPQKNWVCWSAIIAGFIQNDKFIDGLELFKEMQRQGVGVSQSTYASVFRSCAGLSALRLGCQLHAHALKNKFGTDIIVATATLDMYAKCQRSADSRRVFNSLPIRSVQCYNAMIVGYIQNGQGSETLLLFQLLRTSGLHFDEISLSGTFTACAVTKELPAGCQLHGLAIKNNFESNVCVANAILDIVLKAAAGEKTTKWGMEIHCRAIKSGMGYHSFVGSTLVDMYCKYGMVHEGMKLHYRLEEQNIVSWNAIISGYLLQDENEEAQRFFALMLEMGMQPDNFTYATVLDTCANLATVGLGKQIHAQIIKHEMQSDVYVVSTLVDMYSKTGNMQDSHLMFTKAQKRDFVTWNAMICGYAYHGFAEEALKVFEDMKMENVRPNHATFVAVLRACGHMGLVQEGWDYFCSMPSYGLDPQLEHYSCMVDMLGKSGQVGKALKLIEDMPFEADDVIWRTLLSVCKMYGNVEVAEKAANSILQLDPHDSSVYILLSNIYADAGMWGKVSGLRMAMRENKVKKEPGCSWIEVMGDVHTFLANEKAHPRREEIFKELNLLYGEMRLIELLPHDGCDFNVEIENPTNYVAAAATLGGFGKFADPVGLGSGMELCLFYYDRGNALFPGNMKARTREEIMHNISRVLILSTVPRRFSYYGGFRAGCHH